MKQAQFIQLAAEKRPGLPHHRPGLVDVLRRILQRADRRLLGKAVHRIHDAGAANHVNQLLRARHEADPKPRQRKHLGKRPEYQQIGVFAEQLHPVGKISRFDKLAVGFVQHHDLPAIDPVKKPAQFCFVPVTAGRIVGTAEEQHFGPRVNRRQHRFGVKAVILAEWNQSRFITGKLGHPLIHGESLVASDDVVAFLTKRLDYERNHLVGAIADDERIRRKTEQFSQLCPQVKGIAARIDRGLEQLHGCQRLQRFRRRPQGVFIVVQAINPFATEHLPQHVIRLAGDVGFDMLDMAGHQRFQRRKRTGHCLRLLSLRPDQNVAPATPWQNIARDKAAGQ